MRSACRTIVITVGLAAAAASISAVPSRAQTTPPLTADDYRGFMKKVGSTFPSMQSHLKSGMTDEAAKEAQTLATTFGDVERFWMENKKADAAKLAQQARTYAIQAAGAATAGDAMKASMAANNMQGMCKQCHGMYREIDPENAGGFRIKPGAIASR